MSQAKALNELKSFIKECNKNGTIDKSVNKELVELIQKYGSSKSKPQTGMPEETKKKISEAKKGKVWVCDPHPSSRRSKQVPKDKVNEYLANGWIKGRLEFCEEPVITEPIEGTPDQKKT